MTKQPQQQAVLKTNRAKTAVTCCLIFVLWFTLFWSIILGQRQFAYRDTASLYFPLFKWIDQQWLAGEIPLWNSQDNLGYPLVSDATSSVFYPGKIIFFARFVPYPARFGFYVGIHILIAALGAFWCARVFACGHSSAALAAVAFGFGAPVVFQTCNVVFLIGASWLPWAIGCLWRFKSSGQMRYLVCLSILLALMVVGGDPQMTYHVGIVAALVIVFGKIGDSTGVSHKTAAIRKSKYLCLLVCLSLGLAAIQLIPSFMWSQRSERSVFIYPRSIYEIPRHVSGQPAPSMSRVAKGIFGRPVVGTHHDALYEFSFPPWLVAEAFWPNFFGKLSQPEDDRWSSALPGADRIWVPSLYCGLIVFLLAVWQLRFARGDPVNRFLSYLLTFFLLGSFGWYGLGWLTNEFLLMRGGSGLGETVGKPVAGVYWLMVVLLPFYVSFRYPAKLTVLVAFAIAMLAAIGLERLKRLHSVAEVEPTDPRSPVGRTSWIALFIIAVSALMLAFSLVFPADALDRFVRLSLLIESVDINKAVIAIRASLIHTLVVAGGALIVYWYFIRKQKAIELGSLAIVLLTTVDVIVATWWMTPTVRIPLRTEHPVHDLSELPSAIYRPDSVINYGSKSLFEATPELILKLQQSSLYPKHHLETESRLVGSYSSIEPLDFFVWKRAALEASGTNTVSDEVLSSIGVEGAIQPMGYGSDGYGFPIKLISTNNRQQNLPTGFRLVQQFERLPPIDERDFSAVVDRTREVIDRIQQNSTSIVVESDAKAITEWPIFEARDHNSNKFVAVERSKNAVRVKLETVQPALLVIPDYYDTAWRAVVIDESTKEHNSTSIHRVNRIMRGVIVPAGSLTVELRYRPVRFYLGVWISVATFLTLLGGIVFGMCRRR